MAEHTPEKREKENRDSLGLRETLSSSSARIHSTPSCSNTRRAPAPTLPLPVIAMTSWTSGGYRSVSGANPFVSRVPLLHCAHRTLEAVETSLADRLAHPLKFLSHLVHRAGLNGALQTQEGRCGPLGGEKFRSELRESIGHAAVACQKTKSDCALPSGFVSVRIFGWSIGEELVVDESSPALL